MISFALVALLIETVFLIVGWAFYESANRQLRDSNARLNSDKERYWDMATERRDERNELLTERNALKSRLSQIEQVLKGKT